jgi:hypothetical protein
LQKNVSGIPPTSETSRSQYSTVLSHMRLPHVNGLVPPELVLPPPAPPVPIPP